jgi:tyrosyl-tRNA synthetase
MTLYEAMNIWEEVAFGDKSRNSAEFINSIKQFGKHTIAPYYSNTKVSDIFIEAGLCESKGDFKRCVKMGCLFVDELRVLNDSNLSTDASLLRKGKKDVVAIVWSY